MRRSQPWRQVKETREAEPEPVTKCWWSLGNAKWRQSGSWGKSEVQSLSPLSWRRHYHSQGPRWELRLRKGGPSAAKNKDPCSLYPPLLACWYIRNQSPWDEGLLEVNCCDPLTEANISHTVGSVSAPWGCLRGRVAPCNIWNIIILKIIHCLSKIQI